MWTKISSFLTIAIFVAVAVSLFIIKDNVGNLSYQIAEINRQINFERNKIHMLKAEMAYLTSPERLRTLARIHLSLDNIKPQQMIKNPLLSNEKDQIVINLLNNQQPVKIHTKWRYKRSPNKYLKTISTKE